MTKPKKSASSFIAIFALALSSILLNPDTAFAAPNNSCNTGVFDGNGSQGAPYLVSDAEDLAEVIDCGGNDFYFLQTADIELSGEWGGTTGFQGNYDGQLHSISNIFIDGNHNGFSLFPGAFWADITNLRISGTIVNAKQYSGLLAGFVLDSSISNIEVATDISLDPNRDAYSATDIGGAIGYSQGTTTISNVNVSGIEEDSEVVADRNVGGVLGSGYDIFVENSTSSINVRLDSDSDSDWTDVESGAGGLVGRANNLSSNPAKGIYNSTASGNVVCVQESSYCGGLVGINVTTIDSSSASGDVSGNNYLGGLVGDMQGQLQNSFATGNVASSGTGFSVGGLLGQFWTGEESYDLEKVFSTGNVSGISRVGGLIGGLSLSDCHFNISNSYSLSDIQASTTAGGLIGDVVGLGSDLHIANTYFGGEFTFPGTFDGLIANAGSIEVSAIETYWNTQGGKAKSAYLSNKIGAKPKTFFARSKTFKHSSWDLENVWKLDKEFQDGMLSLRGVGTSEEVGEAVPACTKFKLTPILFKKNSIKFTNATREAMRQNAYKILTSYCSTIKIFGYSSKDEPTKKQNKLALQRATAVANFVRGQLEQNWVYLKVIPVGKGVFTKGKLSKNRKALSTIIN